MSFFRRLAFMFLLFACPGGSAHAAAVNGVNEYSGNLGSGEVAWHTLRLEAMYVRSTRIKVIRGDEDSARDAASVIMKDTDDNTLLKCVPHDANIWCELKTKPSRETVVKVGIDNMSTKRAMSYEILIEDR